MSENEIERGGLPEPDEDGMVTLPSSIPIKDLIEKLQAWPSDALVGISLVSIYEKDSPTFQRLYFLEDLEERRILVGTHECWTDNGMVADDEEKDENGNRKKT